MKIAEINMLTKGSTGFVYLIVSGSYLLEPIFFMMIGLFMNEKIFQKQLKITKKSQGYWFYS